jgi:hypothetical protein
MHTPATEPAKPPGLGDSVKEVAERASTLARLELELAQLEIKRKLTVLGIGAAFGLAAAVVAVYAIGFLFATIAAGLAEFLPTWLALLIVTLFLLLVVALLGALAMRAFKRGGPPVPEQAIAEARETTEALKS